MAGDTGTEAIGRGLAAIPSGCSILTCRDGDRSTGLLASWIQQASFEPPLVTVAIKKGRPVQALLERSSRFVLNVLGPEPKALLRHFGRGFDLDDDAFDGLAAEQTDFGVELDGVVAHLACEIKGTFEAGDHILYLAEVCAANRLEELDPYVHVRKTGLSYCNVRVCKRPDLLRESKKLPVKKACGTLIVLARSKGAAASGRLD